MLLSALSLVGGASSIRQVADARDIGTRETAITRTMDTSRLTYQPVIGIPPDTQYATNMASARMIAM